MSGAAHALLRRAGEWLLEPAEQEPAEPALYVPGTATPGPSALEEEHPLRDRRDGERPRPLTVVPPPRHPLVGVVGLAPRCGATTIARAIAVELAARTTGAAAVGSSGRPAAVALGSTGAAVALARALGRFHGTRPVGRLCLVPGVVPEDIDGAARALVPAVVEVEPGTPAAAASRVVDRIVLVAVPRLDPALAAAVADAIEGEGPRPLVVVNRAPDHGPWLTGADVLVPDSRLSARLALSGREPRGWLGRSIEALADLCLEG